MTDRAVPARLKNAFQDIAETRMAGLPILNPGLTVETVGFRLWQGEWIGVLVTPWFMNLMCLPGPDAAAETAPSGSTRRRTLPGGEFEFLTANDERVGDYLSCSLFSPMHDFQDMASALEVAEAIIHELFKQPAEVPDAPAGIADRLAQPVNRRGFLSALLPRERQS
jgi:[NiFe] hydrogenase assembly HybE family chaperone